MHATQPRPSNVIFVVDVPSELLNANSKFLQECKSKFQSFGAIERFEPLQKFERLRITYRTTEGAMLARQMLEGTVIENYSLKLFYGKYEKLEKPEEVPEFQLKLSDFLEVPLNDKMILISPPASPPVGWESMEEAPPVRNDDILKALQHLGGAPLVLHKGTTEAHDYHVPTILVTGIKKDDVIEPSPSLQQPHSFPKATLESMQEIPTKKLSTLSLKSSVIPQTICPPRSSIPQTQCPNPKILAASNGGATDKNIQKSQGGFALSVPKKQHTGCQKS